MVEDISGRSDALPLRSWVTPASSIPEAVSPDGRYEIRKFRVERGDTETLWMGGDSLPRKTVAVPLEDIEITVFLERFSDEELEDRDRYSHINYDRLFPDRRRGGWYVVWMSDAPSEYFEMASLIARIRPDCWEEPIDRKKVLVGGLGLGIAPHILSLRRDVGPIAVVEKNRDVVRWVGPHLPKGVRVVEGDLLEVLPAFAEGGCLRRAFFGGDSVDVVLVDIWSNAEVREARDEIYLESASLCERHLPQALPLFWDYEGEMDGRVLSAALDEGI
jgi:hypothetical protein